MCSHAQQNLDLKDVQTPAKSLTPKSTVSEILKLAWFPTVGMLFSPIYIVINVATIGRMGDVELAGFGLGSLTLGILLISTSSCFAMNVGTLVAQASGAQQHRLCRVYLYRQYYLNALFFPVVFLPMFFIRQIYTLIGQDPEISDYAARYVWIVMPSIYCHINMMAAAQFAQNQKHTKVQFYALVISAVLHLGLVMLFVHVFDWGFTGVAVATNIMFVVRFVIVVYQIETREGLKNTNKVVLFSKETTQNLSHQVQLGLNGLLMGIWGSWAFDIFTLIASYLSVDQVSAQTIMRSLGMLTFTIPCGFSTACGILVGRSIGRGCVRSLKHYYAYCMYLSVAVAIFQNAVLYLFENQIIGIFTDIEVVAQHIRQAWFVFNIFVIVDTTQGVAVSVLRASGQQKTGAVVTWIAYWVLGIPITCLMVFKFSMGNRGIWIGPTVACAFNTVAYILLFKKISWQSLIQAAKEQRTKDSSSDNTIKKCQKGISNDDEFKRTI